MKNSCCEFLAVHICIWQAYFSCWNEYNVVCTNNNLLSVSITLYILYINRSYIFCFLNETNHNNDNSNNFQRCIFSDTHHGCVDTCACACAVRRDYDSKVCLPCNIPFYNSFCRNLILKVSHVDKNINNNEIRAIAATHIIHIYSDFSVVLFAYVYIIMAAHASNLRSASSQIRTQKSKN